MRQSRDFHGASEIILVRACEQAGVIEKKVVPLDAERRGMGLVVFACISLAGNDEASLHEFEQRLREYPDVLECYTVTGSADYFLEIVTRDIKHDDRFPPREPIHMPLVSDVNSNVAVTRIGYTTGLPIETRLEPPTANSGDEVTL